MHLPSVNTQSIDYTEHELIMNQIKAAWNDHVSEDSEICLHTWFVGVNIMFVILCMEQHLWKVLMQC